MEQNLEIQGKTKDENPICHPEYIRRDWKFWYKFLTAVYTFRAQVIINQK